MSPKEEPREDVLPPAPAPSAPNKPPAKSAANTKGRDDALKTIATARRATAWQIHRWPLEKRIVHERTRVHLPRTYLGTDGEDVRAVHAGADLNQFVHRHYLAPVERAQLGRTNFVTADTVVARRHEYLGPDPRVAGYFLDVDGDAHIKWWDAFLQDQWMDRQKWAFDVRLDEDGNWVEKDD